MLSRAEKAEEKLEKVREWRNENLDGGCTCSHEYLSRGWTDSKCEWHNIETAVLDAILAPGGGEKG